MENCLFCKIVQGEIPCEKVLEDSDFLAFKDINPRARVHVLVVPRKHVSSLNELEAATAKEGGASPEVDGQALLDFVVRVARASGIEESGYRAIVDVGPHGGQEVPHLHFHVLGGEDLGDLR